jgi:hypothetical protein
MYLQASIISIKAKKNNFNSGLDLAAGQKKGFYHITRAEWKVTLKNPVKSCNASIKNNFKDFLHLDENHRKVARIPVQSTIEMLVNGHLLDNPI